MGENTIVVGPCKCGGYGICHNEEAEKETGLCHREMGECAFEFDTDDAIEELLP